MSDNYEDLDSFANDYKPTGNVKPGLDALTDGEYDFEIVEAKLDRTPKTGDRIFRVGLRVMATGTLVEKTYFLKTSGNINVLGSDLMSLGLDADKWGTAQRPLSQELPGACNKLKGLCFRGKKVAKQEGDNTYHNLYIQRLIAKSSIGNAPPSSYGPPAETIPF